MTTKLIRIGNSRGVRLPKVIIEQAGLREGKIELLVRDDEVVLRSASPRTRKRNAREGWDEQIKAALAEHGNELTDEDREWLDAPLDPEADDSEWVW